MNSNTYEISPLLRDYYIRIILEGTLNKYECDAEKLMRLVQINLDEVLAQNDEATLLSKVAVYERTEGKTEFNNLCVCVAIIENFWRISRAGSNAMSRIFHVLTGCEYSPLVHRVTASVEDYKPEIAVPPEETFLRFSEIETFSEVGIGLLENASLRDQCEFLAYIYGKLIGIHPFTDANGRVARYWVQYALRCWGMPPVAIPKVRNDQGWKLDLDFAVAGNHLMLGRNIERRVRNVLIELSWPKPMVRMP